MSKMFSPPAWHPTATATDRGWVAPETGELLIACKDLCALIKEFNDGKVVEQEVIESTEQAVEPVIVEEVSDEQSDDEVIEDGVTETNDAESKQDDLADAEESAKAPTSKQPAKRGRKPNKGSK